MLRPIRFLALTAVLTTALAVPAMTPAMAQAPTRHEAENAAVSQGTVESNHAGFSGTGFVNYDNVAGGYVEFVVNAPSAGTASIVLRYANGTTTNRPMTIAVNGTSLTRDFPGTGAWSTWASTTITAPVNAGANTIRATATTAGGGPNLDYAEVDVAAPASEYQAENAVISQGIVDTKHAGYTGSGFVDYANVEGSYVEFTVDAAAAGNAALTFRYANGTTVNRPLAVAVNGTSVNRDFPGTGAWSTWAETTVNAALRAGPNTVRATATTANGGPNLDRLTVSAGGPSDTEKPTAPGGLRSTATTSSSISLAWNASTDNSGTIKDYRVYEGASLKATVSGTSATITGLAPSSTHTYTVTARDPSDNESDRSASVTATTQAGGTGTPVQANGQLKVCGVRLCNERGEQIQLRGMSTHGLQWYSQCLNTASLDALATDWKSDILRISMYIQDGGYESNPRQFTDRVHNLIEMATARGMYAIVDWHMLDPGDPMYNLSRAKTFFTEIAQRHNGKNNLLYEIANEPSGVSWSTIRNYAHQLIPVIRQNDPDTPILVGTRAWSSLGVSEGSDENEVVANPVNATNIMYTFHFYAASHGSDYLNTLSRAADRIPVFVTEFGTQEATGDGPNNFTRSQQYIDLMAQKKISWVNWNYSDDFRSGAVFTTGTCPNGPFAGTSRLKPAGVWIRDRVRAD
ncbi:cellulase family glycosylhydrolase [Nonomuraea dietziae]|uniref:cellulase n=1 Tax=Nonomuraea dietziae TaxID=65515 RepID=A0A7W5V2F5_9ACTN|nr:cellulase family glycosylhydrolase [Nonomuraea dietziae]MBB3727664.1 endoglucanase [Nonomuraea dietziae]